MAEMIFNIAQDDSLSAIR